MLLRALTWLTLWVTLLAATPAMASEILDHERFTLDNGMQVILHVDRRLPVIAVDLAYHVGTMHDGPTPGLAHLVEHLMFRGTQHMADGELNERLFDAGALGTNAATHYDHTTYHTMVPADQLPLVLWLESDRMAYTLAAITETTVDQERQTTVDEWESRVSSERDGAVYWGTWNALFGAEHPFHSADPAAIARLRSGHARELMRRHYGPANATLVLAGDLPDDVRELVQRHFGRRRGGQAPTDPVVTQTLTQEQRIAQRSPLATTATVVVAWPTPGLYARGDADADVLAATLGADRLSSMVEARAPATFIDIDAQQVSRAGQSLFVISARGGADAEPQVMLEAIDGVLDDLRTQPVTADDVRRAARRLRLRMLLNVQRLDGRAALLRLYSVHGKDPDWLDQDLARYDTVDERSVAEFVDAHLSPSRRVVMLASPARETP